ncbi:hypothetical protein [Streptomyces sp. NPDC058595]|uniref:hypothetical protein n=1 Tax=Streptomyces sp. NPDC058595 TaxID=3346550 RepID=UPI003653A332
MTAADANIDSDPLPHQGYIAAVAAAVGAAPRYATERFVALPECDGLLAAVLHYPPDTGGGHSALPHGLFLLWDQRAGWRWVPGGVTTARETPLPVPVLAAPSVLARLLPELLAGRTAELVATREQWPLTPTHRRLLGRLDVVEGLLDSGWTCISAPYLPVVLTKGPATWLLTAHHDIWRDAAPGSDWRDSRLSSPAGTESFGVGVPGKEILDAARDAVAGTWTPSRSLPAGRRPRVLHAVPGPKDPT